MAHKIKKTSEHMNLSAVLAIFALSLFSLSCSKPGEEQGTKPVESPKVETMTIEGISSGNWVYVSLSEGLVVGESKFGDTESDKQWNKRLDWDIAFCGEYIRMNGGTSGKGNAAIQNLQNKSFNALEEAPLDGYLYDSENVIVK